MSHTAEDITEDNTLITQDGSIYLSTLTARTLKRHLAVEQSYTTNVLMVVICQVDQQRKVCHPHREHVFLLRLYTRVFLAMWQAAPCRMQNTNELQLTREITGRLNTEQATNLIVGRYTI